MDAKRFRKIIWAHFNTHGRHDLPWRGTRDPYEILVSEIMLQQTQVARVKPFYENFLEKFPTVRALAKAPLSEVLKAWQGLGYNRRAKMLHMAARTISNEYNRKFPHEISELEKLSGVGPYTARALATFAFNAECVCIETNIRTAVIYHFFSKNKKVLDKEIEKILKKLLPKGKSREWHYALMDYGAHLKQGGMRINARSAHYVQQSKFQGSAREARGAILRELSRGAQSAPRLLGLLGDDRKEQLRAALATLLAEGLVQKHGLASRGRVFSLRD